MLDENFFPFFLRKKRNSSRQSKANKLRVYFRVARNYLYCGPFYICTSACCRRACTPSTAQHSTAQHNTPQSALTSSQSHTCRSERDDAIRQSWPAQACSRASTKTNGDIEMWSAYTKYNHSQSSLAGVMRGICRSFQSQ